MVISGETIRQEAARHEDNCPDGMKNSFYYGFREGAKWMQHKVLNLLRMDPSDDDKLATQVGYKGTEIFPPEGYLIGNITDVDNGMLVELVKK